MIGGFLGAGKTTAVARLARRLTEEGRRVGLISNDQSTGLVDTALLRDLGRAEEARDADQRALALTDNPAERALLMDRIGA